MLSSQVMKVVFVLLVAVLAAGAFLVVTAGEGHAQTTVVEWNALPD